MDALRQTRRWPWQPFTVPLTANCGNKPKLLAIGIAPLGIISIGIVVAGFKVMGIWKAGDSAQHQHNQPAAGTPNQNLYAYPSKQDALRDPSRAGTTAGGCGKPKPLNRQP